MTLAAQTPREGGIVIENLFQRTLIHRNSHMRIRFCPAMAWEVLTAVRHACKTQTFIQTLS